MTYSTFTTYASTFLILFVPFMFLNGCVSSESSANQQGMQVVSSLFEPWSAAPSGNSDVPEKGTDLTLIVENWPEGFTPRYIIRNQHKSLSATVEERQNNKVVITGRIIRSSAVMKDKSEQVEQSDRLAYTDDEGETGFIEINSWHQAETQ